MREVMREREGMRTHGMTADSIFFFLLGSFTVVAIGSQHPWEVGLISALRLWL